MSSIPVLFPKSLFTGKVAFHDAKGMAEPIKF